MQFYERINETYRRFSVRSSAGDSQEAPRGDVERPAPTTRGHVSRYVPEEAPILSRSPIPLLPTLDSDDDLQRRVRAFLGSRHFRSLRRLRIEVRNGAVVISGTVPTFHQRQVACECVRHVAGVLRVVDYIEVSDLLEEHQPHERNEP